MSKHNRTENIKKISLKAILLSLTASILLCSIVAGTVAWLITETDPVVNTFTYGDINIGLTETDVDGDEDPLDNTYKMIPGSVIDKDPTVTVKAGSEACWLFVKLEESTDAKFSDFMTYTVAEGWTKLEETSEIVYFRAVDAVTADTEFGVLADDEVRVLDTVTKQNLNELTQDTYPTLTVTAYAVQKENIESAVAAWNLVVGE